jgi:endonuclease-3 related protein
MLLYLAGRPVFVLDGPMRRVLARHRLLPAGRRGESLRLELESRLPSDPELLRDLHGRIAVVARTHCRLRPICESCPLRFDLRGRRPASIR